MNQTWENDKKSSFGPVLAPLRIFRSTTLPPKFLFPWILPLLGVRHCCKLSLYAILRKSNESNLRKRLKSLALGQIWTHVAKIRIANFSSKIWLQQSLDVMVSYHHVQYQKKLMIQSWKNLVTDGQTDRPTDGQEWFHRMLSN